MSSTNPKVELDSELESFRQKWLSDLRHKNEPSQPPSFHTRQPSLPKHHLPSTSTQVPIQDDNDLHQALTFDEPLSTGHSLDGSTSPKQQHADPVERELVSALDHFEEAMEREAQGNMGASLTLYRKAYKLDNGVDKRYREKHFPHPHKRPPIPVPKPAGAPSPQHDSQPLATTDLIASFSNLSIQPTPPEVEGMPPPSCPISNIPDELLIHILSKVAEHDVADFARLSLVCRRLAYLIATEQGIWREVCLGEKFGFQGMFYHWNTTIDWTPLEEEEVIEDGDVVLSPTDLIFQRNLQNLSFTKSLTPSVYPTWKSHFRHRPRIRFNGCYISTVNYIRTGQASTNQSTWGGSPIHIVTYYRYLRLYRDGSAISLLTTSDPAEVVHYMTKEAVALHRDKAHALPGAVMHLALKGRWRLGNMQDEEEEGDLVVETEGVKAEYMYRMDLSLRSAGKGARNNKVVWRSFHSYNKLTDDWGEFGLKNDKPFFFSRVKSYGLGE